MKIKGTILLTITCFLTCASTESDPFGAVYTNPTAKGTQGSLEQLEYEYDRYGELLKGLKTSRNHRMGHWLPIYGDAAISPLIAGGLVGGTAYLTPKVLAVVQKYLLQRRADYDDIYRGSGYFSRKKRAREDHAVSSEPMISTPALLLGIGGATVATLEISRLLKKITEAHRYAGRLKSFLISWPEYRAFADDTVRALVEPLYAQFSHQGKLALNSRNAAALYHKLAYYFAHRQIVLQQQIDQFRHAEKEKERRTKQQHVAMQKQKGLV